MNKISQKYRFPEFLNELEWTERKLSDVLNEHGLKSTGNEEVYSVSVHKGVVNQVEHLGRSFSASNTDNYKRVLHGDVIYTKSPTGNFPLGIIKQSKVNFPVIVSPLYGVFTPETYGLGYILDAYFESPSNVHNYLSSIIQKGAKNTININNTTFLSKSLYLPNNKDEQQKIASCLSSLDELIAAHTDKLEALKDHKKGLMQQLFPAEGDASTGSAYVPKLRFKEFENDGEWMQKCLGDKDVSFFVNEKISVNKLKVESYISTENMLPDFSGVSNASKLPLAGNFTQYKSGDILISNIRPYLKKVWKSDRVGGASNDVNVFRSGSEVLCEFLEFILKNEAFINYIMESAKGVKMPRGDKDSMKKYIVFIPSKAEQQKIANFLSSIDDKIAAQAQKIEGLKEHKKGLMQGLFPVINE